MPKTKPDFTNPRQLLLEIHKILRDLITSRISNKDLERWKKKRNISDEKWRHVYKALNHEIIAGLAKLFPIYTINDVNFHANEGVDGYSGQLFSSIIFKSYYDELLPFIRTWEGEYDVLTDSFDKLELMEKSYLILFEGLIDFEKKYQNQLLLHEMTFSRHLGSYWYLPVYKYDIPETFRIVLPVERLLSKFVELKGYHSRDGMAKEAVAHHKNEDIKEGDYWQIEKSLDRLSKGELISLTQINKLRKIRFSRFIIDEHWNEKSEDEKVAHILAIRNVSIRPQ